MNETAADPSTALEARAPAGRAAPRRAGAAASPRFNERKEAILNAAAVLINRVGLGETTLALVAAEIGLNLKSLRYYFERREDLVVAAYLRSIALHRTLVAAAAKETTGEARVTKLVQEYLTLSERVERGEQPRYAYFGDLCALTGTHATVVYREYNLFFRDVRELLAPRPEPWDRSELNARTHLLISQLLWAMAWIPNYVPEDFGRVAERFSDSLLHGVAACPVDLPRRAPAPVANGMTGDRLSQEAFLRTATALINEQGHRGASVERISATLNVSRGAFYHHYDTRDALVVACFERTFDELRAAQSAGMGRGASGMAKVASTVIDLVEQQMAVEGFMLRTTALSVVGPQLRAEMTRRMSLATFRFADMLSDGVGDGSVRVADLRIASEMVTATINSAAELGRWVRGAGSDDVAGLYVRPLLHGLLSAPGGRAD